MRRINSIYQIPDVVLDGWRKDWNSEEGFEMRCGGSRYSVPASNKYDMWVWVDSNARHPGFRGRVELAKS